MKELVSVVVPTFNRPQGLRKALQSVLNQTHQDFEVLVVNDSPDDISAKQILEDLGDPRLRYFKNKRKKGANGARNTGILQSKGPFIAFLDDDDEWLPEKLEWQLSYLKHHPEHVGLFSAYSIDESGRWRVKNQAISALSLTDCLLNTVSIGSSSSLLFRREIFDQVGLWDEQLLRQQDKELLVRILVYGSVGYDPRVSIKVNGHNDPHPLKSIPGHEIYFAKVAPYLKHLDEDAQNRFHSFHYRRLCMYYLKLGDYGKALDLYRSALPFQKFHLRKDVKNLVHLFKSLLSTKPSY